MATRDWLSGWNRRYARLLTEVDTRDARAALVDTNGDGRELWFGLDIRGPSGEWDVALDWDDAGGHHPPERLDNTPVVFGWGTGRPRQRKVVDYNGRSLPIRVGSNGWWLLLACQPGRGPIEPH